MAGETSDKGERASVRANECGWSVTEPLDEDEDEDDRERVAEALLDCNFYSRALCVVGDQRGSQGRGGSGQAA